MSKGVYVALSGAIAQENAMETTANNVANSASAGYQRLRPVFREALANARAADRDLHYAKTDRTALDTTAGALRSTERALDVALPAGTYLAVTTPRGERYTRSGALAVDAEGTLKTASGATITSDAGTPIQAARGAGEVTVSADGTVKQGANVLGKLKMMKFERPDALEHEGSSLLAVGNAGAATPSTEPLTIGALEESNAQPVTAMTELMTASRTFDAFQKVLDQFGEIDRKLVTTVPNAGD